MPEVMRQIAREIACNAASLEDTEIWISRWLEFLTGLGIGELAEDADDIAKDQWAEEVVAAFCAKPSMKVQLNYAIAELSGEK
jgi:hypothetical protein